MEIYGVFRVHREQILVPPQGARALLDAFATYDLLNGIVVVDYLYGAEAIITDVDWIGWVVAATRAAA